MGVREIRCFLPVSRAGFFARLTILPLWRIVRIVGAVIVTGAAARCPAIWLTILTIPSGVGMVTIYVRAAGGVATKPLIFLTSVFPSRCG